MNLNKILITKVLFCVAVYCLLTFFNNPFSSRRLTRDKLDVRVPLNENFRSLPNKVPNKTLVLYAYVEISSLYQYTRTLKYFIELGVEETEQVDYVFIIQGYLLSVQIPKFKNIRVLYRPNDCYDFGAYGKAIEWLGGIDSVTRKYAYFMFVIPSALGPILPKYWPEDQHWTRAFTSQLKGDVHACSASLTCLPASDLGGYGPRLGGMAFAATLKAVQAAWSAKTVFACHRNKANAIVNGEYGFSRALLNHSLNFDTLLSKYGGIDWRNEANWQCNENKFPDRKNSYDDHMTVHPYETVFYKPLWLNGGEVISEAYVKETFHYLEWAVKRKAAKKPIKSKFI